MGADPKSVGPLTLDISANQNGGRAFTIDQFRAFKAAGVGRVIIKLGGSNSGSGLYVELLHQDNARAAGLLVDHYWANGTQGTPAEVTARILATGQVRTGETLWWDVEHWDNPSGRIWTPQELGAHRDALAAAGVPTSRQGAYLSNSLADDGGYRPAGLKLWLANYNTGPCLVRGGWTRTDLALRQHTSTGQLPGYLGNLDLNRAPHDVWTVEELQAALTHAGYPATVDNRFGSGTERAVSAFQAAAGLKIDGNPGPATLTRLGKEAA